MSLRFAILGFLSVRPMSGYDLKRTFDTSVRHFWSADQAAIYRALNELEAEGLVRHERVAQETRPDRKVHSLTDAGLRELDAWLVEPVQPQPRREPLLVKLFFASRLDRGALRSLIQTELDAVEEELGVFSGIVAGMGAQIEGSKDVPPGAFLGPLITLTNGAQLGIAYRDWLRGLLRAEARDKLTAEHLLVELKKTLGS